MEKAELTALIVRAQAGDPAAVEALLRTAHTSVSYQCRKMLRDPRDAEDMTQEVMLTVYTRLNLLKNPETFWGWLNSITVNRCINALRRNHVELQFAEDEEGHSVLDNLEELDEQQVPDRALDNAETTRMVEEIVDSLPEAQRICVLMYYYDEMSVREIADTLGVPENTVKSRLNYARKAIKERVLDHEKKGVKLYGLSPLPFLLFFLLRAANESADGAKAAAVARRVMEAGATGAAAGGMAAGGGTAGGAAAGGIANGAATGAAAAAGGAGAAAGAAAGGVTAKVVAGLLAGLLLLGGGAAAVVLATRSADEPEPTLPPAITDTVPLGTADPEPTVEVSEPPLVEEELVPADRLALLTGIAYYGDPARCRMTVNQASAYAELIENSAASYAALMDVGEGRPVLVMALGTDHGEYQSMGGYSRPDWHFFTGKLEVWQYINGQAVRLTAAHVVRWKEDAELVCYTHLGATEDENGNVLPAEDQVHYLDYTESVYRAEGGVLSETPLTTITAGLDPSSPSGWSGDIDGRPFSEEEYYAWTDQWTDWNAGWTSMGVSYDTSNGGPVDYGMLDIRYVSPGADVAGVLRQCAGE